MFVRKRRFTYTPSSCRCNYKILVAIDGSKEEKNYVQFIAIHVLLSQIGYAYNSSDIYILNTSSSIRELLEDIKKEAHKWFNKIKEKAAAAAAADIEKNKIQLKTEVITTKRLLLVQ